MELDFTIVAFALKLTYAFLALLLLFIFLRYLDYRIEKDRGPFAKTMKGAGLGESALAKAIYYGLRFAGGALLMGMVVGCSPSSAATITDRYDGVIKAAAETYLPGIPWKLLKAQYYQESRLDPAAVSPVGARGIAQFMPATYQEVLRELSITGSPHDDIAIEAGAFYMQKMRRLWRDTPDLERHKLAAASYNAGGGNIRKAARLCGEARAWGIVVGCLPRVTGRHAAETTIYVRNIWRWWAQMEATL